MLPAERTQPGAIQTQSEQAAGHARLPAPQRYEKVIISHPRSLCLIFCPAEAQASAGFFVVERAQILQNSTENCKICAFSILSESTSQKASISHKQENTRVPKYRQNLRWAVILPPARAPPFLTFAYPRK